MKTGTQSIIHSLKEYCNEFDGAHYQAKELKNGIFSGMSKIQANKNKSSYLTHKYWDEYFKFAFVRNPWDHFLSLYYYMKKNNTTKLDFYSFVKLQYDSKCECLSDWGFTCLWDRVSENDECIVDYVGRFEDMDNEWVFISNKIGVPYRKLGKLNTTDRGVNYRDYYNLESKKMVGEMYKKDIEKFNYHF